MPGQAFRSPEDFNTQLTEWLPNTYVVRRISGRPIDLVSLDTAAMFPLLPVPPLTAHARRSACRGTTTFGSTETTTR